MKSLKSVLAVFCALTLLFGCFGTAALALEDPDTCDHAWGWIVDVEPTCTDGMKHLYCPKCGSVKDEGTMIPATQEHEWEWVVDVPPTDTVAGYKHEACKNCDAVRNMNTKIPATRDGADFGEAILKWIDVIGNYFYSIINQIRALFDNARA